MNPKEPNPPIDPELLELERQLKGAPRLKSGPVKVSRTSAKLLGAKKGDVVDTEELKRKEALRERRLKKWALIATAVFVLLVALFGLYKFVVKGGGSGRATPQTPSRNGSPGGGGTQGPAPTATAEVREYQRLMGEFRTLKREAETFVRENIAGKPPQECAAHVERLGQYKDQGVAFLERISELREPGVIPDSVYEYYITPMADNDTRDLEFVRNVLIYHYTAIRRELERQNTPPSNP